MRTSYTAIKFVRNLAIFGLLSVAACQTSPEPTLYVTPSPILSGDPITIEVQNIDPDVLVALRLDEIRLRLNTPAYYSSSATFEAGADGRVSTTNDAPIDGDYSGVDPTGLFWSRQRPEDQQPDETAELQPLTLSVDIGNDGSVEFEQAITIVRAFEGIVTEDLGPEFPGAFLARTMTEGPHPVIIV